MSRSAVRQAFELHSRVQLLEEDVDRLEAVDGSVEARIMARIDKFEAHVTSRLDDTNQRISRLLITAVGLLGSVAVGIVIGAANLLSGG